MDVAKLRVQLFSLLTQQKLSQIKKTKLLGQMTQKKNIGDVIRDFRKYVEDACQEEQDSYGYEDPYFEENMEHIYSENLKLLEEWGLLDLVHENLRNVGELAKRVMRYKREGEKREATKILKSKFIKRYGIQEKNTTIVPPEQVNGILLSNLLKEYLEENKQDVEVKTSDKMRSHIGFLIACIGDVNVNYFSQSDLREYKEKLNKKRRMYKGQNILISSVTKNDHLQSCKRFFDFAIGSYNDKLTNYFSNSTIYFKVKREDKKKRCVFSHEELIKIFSHKIFTRGEFTHPYQYWSPLLALFTGSRENEIAQLRVSDIVMEDGIHCISHNLSTEDKKLKTKNENLIPLHPKLIKLGFLNFVELFNKSEYQWEKTPSSHRLFKGLALDKVRGGYQKNLSRWFNGVYNKKTNRQKGFKYEVGITYTENEMKDFHSFRHTLSTELEEVGVSDKIGYMITGHSRDSETSKMNNSAGSIYRHGVSVGKMYKEICKLNFDTVLVNVQPFFEINGKKKCRNQRRKK